MHGKEYAQHMQKGLIGIQVMLENRNIEFEILVTCLKNQYIASYMVHTQLAYRVDCNTGWNSCDKKTHLADLILLPTKL